MTVTRIQSPEKVTVTLDFEQVMEIITSVRKERYLLETKDLNEDEEDEFGDEINFQLLIGKEIDDLLINKYKEQNGYDPCPEGEGDGNS